MPWFTRCRVLAVPDWGCGHLIAAYYGSPIIQLFLVPCQTSAKFGRGPPCGALNTGGIYKFRPFIAARCYASAANAVMQCPSVCPSVTFVNSVKTNKRIFNFFSPTGSHIILVFLYQTSMAIFRWGLPPITGASNAAGGVGRNRDSEPTPGSIECCERLERQVQYTRRDRPWRVDDTRW